MSLDITQPSPSLNMLKRAKRMQIEELEIGWLVWESSHEKHFVTKAAKFFVCDCISYQMRGMCSHVTAVRQSEVEKDKRDLYGGE